MAIKDNGMHKSKKLPKCPKCNCKGTVGRVMSLRDRGNPSSVCKAYFCSNCLTEFDGEGNLKICMYA